MGLQMMFDKKPSPMSATIYLAILFGLLGTCAVLNGLAGAVSFLIGFFVRFAVNDLEKETMK